MPSDPTPEERAERICSEPYMGITRIRRFPEQLEIVFEIRDAEAAAFKRGLVQGIEDAAKALDGSECHNGARLVRALAFHRAKEAPRG